jgi:hypothetical protein
VNVYIDDAFIRAKVGRFTSRWCHLFADTEEELHAFAQSVGLRRSWFQAPKGVGGKPVVPESLKAQQWHYDVTEGRRAACIAAGAVVVTSREAVHIMKARHERLFPEHALPTITGFIADPPEHVWPTLPDDFELREGARWCRRCGRLLWRARDGALPDRPACRYVEIAFRERAS